MSDAVAAEKDYPMVDRNRVFTRGRAASRCRAGELPVALSRKYLPGALLKCFLRQSIFEVEATRAWRSEYFLKELSSSLHLDIILLV